jgi:predicted nucleic acid-binding protein
MRHVSDRFTVILDANVLYPFLVRDVLLSLADAGFYRPRWTREIMDEWQRGLIAAKPEQEQKVRATARTMSDAFPEALVDGYQEITDALTLPDPEDRHVLAAAIKAGAHAIITENGRDFPSAVLAQYGIEKHTADDFILNTIELYPDDAVSALRAMRELYGAPTMSATELILSMAKRGLVQTAAFLQSRLSLL